MGYVKFKKGNSGHWIIATCDKCGETSRPVQKYKDMWLCDVDLAVIKRAELSAKQIKREDMYKNRWDAFTSLPKK